jgi:hypothetical protein
MLYSSSLSLSLSLYILYTQYNDTQFNDTQYNDTHYDGTQYNDPQHNSIQLNVTITKHDTQHNNT